MLAEQPGSDDVCCIRCPKSGWSGAFPQQVSGAVGWVFISCSTQCLQFPSGILILLLHRYYDGAGLSKKLFRWSRICQDVCMPYRVFCCVLAGYAKVE